MDLNISAKRACTVFALALALVVGLSASTSAKRRYAFSSKVPMDARSYSHYIMLTGSVSESQLKMMNDNMQRLGREAKRSRGRLFVIDSSWLQTFQLSNRLAVELHAGMAKIKPPGLFAKVHPLYLSALNDLRASSHALLTYLRTQDESAAKDAVEKQRSMARKIKRATKMIRSINRRLLRLTGD